MSAKSELRVVRKIAKINSNVFGVGADWNERTSSLRVTKSTLKEACHVVVSICPAFWVLLSIFRVAEIHLRNAWTFDLPLQVIFMTLTVAYIATAVIINGFSISRRSLIALFNQLMGLYQPLCKTDAENFLLLVLTIQATPEIK